MDNPVQFWHLWGGWVMAAVLLAVSLGFLVRFALPALGLGRELRAALARLQAAAAEETAPDPEKIGREIMPSPRLAHPWREYAQTLHGATDPRNPGKPAVWRATAMAEEFFSERALVDTPLKTEFYKHLPGILTGIGIIGTFTGLIAGLSQFEVSSNPETVRFGLRGLIQGVGHAFEVSAAAIALAMLATWIEKSLVTRRYREVERLAQAIDGLFDGGVGEEYLARLVRASEASAAQAARLQQAVVGELRQSMETLLTQQQEASLRQQEALAAKVAGAVAQTVGAALKEPMVRMSAAVERLGAGQGNAMSQALERALDRFTGHLDDTFGRRQDGLESLLQRTATAMERAVGELGQMAVRLERAGSGAVESAAGRLDTAGRGVGDAAQAFARTSQDMAGAAAAMREAARSAEQSLAEQRQMREAVLQMVADLRATVELAKREAALTADLVGRLEGAAAALGRAGQEAEDYLEGVSEVLGRAHAAFADNIERTLARGNGRFQQEVAGAVECLKGAVEELADALAQDAVPR